MSASKNNFWNSLFLNNLLKKLFPSPSTRKSWFQILLVLLITVSIVFIIAFIENEQKKFKPQTISQSPKKTRIDKSNSSNFSNNTLTEINNLEAEKNSDNKCEYKINLSTIVCLTSDLKLLAQIQNIAVISAALLFFFDTFDRKKQLERQAWQLIDGAQGSETSGARKQAIEDLYKEGADITGLDADGADLRGINLSGANLQSASFKNAILEKANFEGADLKEAHFSGADLKGANFKKAELSGANFSGADLRAWRDKKIEKNTDFRDADLGFATFNRAKLGSSIFGVINERSCLGQKTNLNGAKFRGVNLNNVNLNRASIAEAKFGGTQIKDIGIISKAKEYEKAYYSKGFCDDYNNSEFEYREDKEYSQDPDFQNITTQKIVEISQRLLSKKSLSLQDKDSLSDFINLLNYLVILVKESDNECIFDENLPDKILDLKNTFDEKEKLRQEGLGIMQDNEDLIKKAKNDLDRLDELEKRKNINKATEQ